MVVSFGSSMPEIVAPKIERSGGEAISDRHSAELVGFEEAALGVHNLGVEARPGKLASLPVRRDAASGSESRGAGTDSGGRRRNLRRGGAAVPDRARWEQ